MPEQKNIQIPYDIFIQLLDIMDYIDISNYDESLKIEFENISNFLKEKKKSINKRNLYKNLILANGAKNEDEKFEAKIKYLSKKNK